MGNNFARTPRNNPNSTYLIMGIGATIFVCLCLVGAAVGGYFLYNRVFNSYEDRIVGTWETEDGSTLKFLSNGTVRGDDGDTARYRIEDDSLIIEEESSDDVIEFRIIEFSDDRMEVTICSDKIVLKKVQ